MISWMLQEPAEKSGQYHVIEDEMKAIYIFSVKWLPFA